MDLVNSIDQEEVDIDVLAKKVSQDQAPAGKIRRLANSSYSATAGQGYYNPAVDYVVRIPEWNFSDTVLLAIAAHHEPALPEAGFFASIVHVAIVIAERLESIEEANKLLP
jgi:HD-like signal output (HDOD) protein